MWWVAYHGQREVEGGEGGVEEAVGECLKTHAPVLHEESAADKDNFGRGIPEDDFGLVVA
jgi:hypothetical protein